jgi:hypothetical protein
MDLTPILPFESEQCVTRCLEKLKVILDRQLSYIRTRGTSQTEHDFRKQIDSTLLGMSSQQAMRYEFLKSKFEPFIAEYIQAFNQLKRTHGRKK